MFKSSSNVSMLPRQREIFGILWVSAHLTKHKTIWKLQGAREARGAFAIPEQREGGGAAPEPYIPAASLCPVLASLTPAVSTAITLFLLI